MRKQKATVWCDRSQSLDPRIAAQQRAAKQRAVMEVHGGTNGTVRTSTITSGGVVGKIRHGGGPKAPGYAGTANLTGAGVPMRLSANEMLGDEEEERSSLEIQHKRTGSGRSSANSARFRSGYPRPSPPDGVSPAAGISESADEHRGDEEYFETSQHRNNSIEDSFGSVTEMKAPSAVHQAVENAKTAEDLRRRGSVDERAMSMGAGVRLFVANPDV